MRSIGLRFSVDGGLPGFGIKRTSAVFHSSGSTPARHTLKQAVLYWCVIQVDERFVGNLVHARSSVAPQSVDSRGYLVKVNVLI